MKKKLLFLLVAMCLGMTIQAQRFSDKLDRGLVVTITQDGVGNFISWRVLGEEYFDVTYNLYADGTLIASELNVSNYVHSAGKYTTKYQVAPVVKGVEGELCQPIVRWADSELHSATGMYHGYKYLAGPKILSRNGKDVTSSYTFNDAVLADVTGDGVAEIIAKRMTSSNTYDTSNDTSFHFIEVMTLEGEHLWRIDMGPNMQAEADLQWDAIAFDWDMDGKAEVLLRGADNMIIHHKDGTTTKIGNMSYDSRDISNSPYTSVGNEYLLYLNGETGHPYLIGENDAKWMAYPLPRYEAGESNEASAWGGGIVGHRPTKHYFGAPYLDGKKPSIFLGRGAYTRHKFTAFDVDPVTHKLKQLWRWDCNVGGPWFGQGYHNFAVGDVDLDGRDEIIFGSMVMDDNGKGLSTTGLGHGDAQHCADHDPYRWGLEQFACNESAPAMNYRNATTSEFYYRLQSTGDDGRALAANFHNNIPGSEGASSQSGIISLTADKVLTNVAGWDLNHRIYWDGDLCSEVLNSPGTARQPKIDKPGKGRIFLGRGGMNNHSKNNPCISADFLGDWREEFIVRDGSGLTIFTSNYPTTFRIPTLWSDHNYRQSMVWQSQGYNQPSHLSYFLGELEGITVAPPPTVNTGRVDVTADKMITAAHNGRQVLVYDNQDVELTVEQGAQPWVVFLNAPSWVQGSAPQHTSQKDWPITYDYYTLNVKGAGFSGGTRVVKQGEGELILSAAEYTHSGPTDIWNGTLTFNGTMKQSSLWLNRHTHLKGNGTFRRIKADYNATIHPADDGSLGTIVTDTLVLGFGSRVKFDLRSEGLQADQINAKLLSLETVNWQYGPAYMTPVFEFAIDNLVSGKYPLGRIDEIKGASLDNIVIEGLGTTKQQQLIYEDGVLYLSIADIRDADAITWNGADSDTWDMGLALNFTHGTNESAFFVTGDDVTFNGNAKRFAVSLKGDLEAGTVYVDGNRNYTFNGSGRLVGSTALHKTGTGVLTISNDNTYTGGTRLSGGTTVVNTLSNTTQTYGALGSVVANADKFIVENGAVLKTTGATTMGSPMRMAGTNGGEISNQMDFIVNQPISGTILTKSGGGWMKLNVSNTVQRMIIKEGTVQCVNCPNPAGTVEFVNGTLTSVPGSNFAINVAEGGIGYLNMVNDASYGNKVTGKGELVIYCPVRKGDGWAATRTKVGCDFSAFEGTLVTNADMSDGTPRFTLNSSSGIPKGTMRIPAGVMVQNTGKVYRIGKVEGTGTLGTFASFANDGSNGINTWQIGSLNEDFTFEAGIVGVDTKFEKIGSGQMKVKSETSTFTGEANIKEGSICLDIKDAENPMLGLGSLTVEDGAALVGRGKLGNSKVVVSPGALLRPGTTETSGIATLDFSGGDLRINSGATLQQYIATAKTCTKLTGIGKMNFRGKLKIIIKESLYPLEEGYEYKLWDASSTTVATSAEFDLQSPGPGLKWDTSRLKDGIICVVSDPTAVSAIAADEQVTCKVFTLGGAYVGTFECNYASMVDKMKQEGLARGTYTIQVVTPNGTQVEKIILD